MNITYPRLGLRAKQCMAVDFGDAYRFGVLVCLCDSIRLHHVSPLLEVFDVRALELLQFHCPND